MAAGPINVNKLLKHISILSSLGVKYTTKTPFAKCPFCHKTQLARFRFNSSSDDMAYYCYSCLYSGDTFDMYRAFHVIESVSDTFTELIAKDYLIISSDALTERDINNYKQSVVDVTTAIDEYWFECKQNLYENNITIGKQILQSLGLWPGIITEHGYYHSAFRFVGLSGLNHVSKAITHCDITSGIKKGYQGFVVYPYELVPGVIRNFVIQTEKFAKKLDNDDGLAPQFITDQGDGFFMLSSVKPTDHTVYAFADPAMAMQAQHSHFSRGATEPAPIVAWGDDTIMENWYSLPGKKVVLYSPELNHEVFLNAILCGYRAHITTEPQVTSAKFYHEEYRNKGVVFHKKMEETAVPWSTAFVGWVMGTTLESSINMITMLPIGFHEKSEIMDACTTQEQRDRLSKVFGSDRLQNKFVEVGSMRIHEENNEWYAVGVDNNTGRERACSHPMYFEEIAVDTDNEIAPIVSGYIRHNTSTFKFSIDLLTFEKNPLSVYKELVLKHVRAIPYISPYLGKRLIETIYAFQQPISVMRPSIIGYSTDTKEFRLANLVISGTGAKSVECSLEKPPTLGLGKYPADLPKEVAYSLTAPGHRNEVFIAVFSSFMRNVLCYAMNIKYRPIGIIGEPWKNPVGWRAVSDIAEAFKIPIHVLTNKPVSALKQILQTSNHRIPLILDISGLSGNEAKEVLLLVKDKNVIVPLTIIQATAIGITGDWSIIDARAISDSDQRAPMTWCAISFLEHYLRIGAPQYSYETCTSMIISDLKGWLLPAAADADNFNKLFLRAAYIARGNRVLREDKVKSLFVDIYTIASTLKKIRMTKWVAEFTANGNIDCGNDIILLDNKADVALIHVKNFIEACNQNGAEVNPSLITEIFNNGGVLMTDKIEKGVYSVPGWAVSGSAWNNAVDILNAEIATKLFS